MNGKDAPDADIVDYRNGHPLDVWVADAEHFDKLPGLDGTAIGSETERHRRERCVASPRIRLPRIRLPRPASESY
jgi:hypothetical protein